MAGQKKSVKGGAKKRNWGFILYPESVKEDWCEILKLSGLKCAVSPLHDKDLNADEHEKKPHWHVIACWEGPTSYAVVKALCDNLNGTNPIALEQVRGMYRYFTHEDNPEKHQYNKSEIQTFNGFSILDYAELTGSEVDRILVALEDVIEDNHFVEYRDFIRWVRFNGTAEENRIARSHTYHLGAYLKSLRHMARASSE